jgi:aspartate dehydrogenase
MRVCLVGCGAIGNVIAKAIDDGKAGECELIAVCDIKKEAAEEMVSGLNKEPKILATLEEVLALDADLVIEAASQRAVQIFGKPVLDSGKDIMIMSVGALVDTAILNELRESARKSGKKVYLPSGAICGLDGVKSASMAGIDSVVLVSRKNPNGFKGVKYLEDKGVNPEEISEETVLYEGPAAEAAQLFPKNINVSAALSIAGIGPENTQVKIIADPKVERNIHHIEVEGDFGSLSAETRNVLSPDNPKTSYLAALSAVATLKKITDPVQVGT